MWTRAELKAKAKDVLRISYWKAFIVSLVIAIVGGGGGGGGGFNGNFGGGNAGNNADPFNGANNEILPIIIGAIIVAVLLALLFALALRIFVGYHVEVGGRRYFIQSAQNDVDMNYLGYGFKKGRYISIIKAMLWRALLNFLWSLLLIIPGIIKSYAYRMVPYILADNPNIDYRRGVELSNEMTRGHKWRMFVLDLSFIGWYLLGTLALFIGVLFVNPYFNATQAELYLVLRQNALDTGMCTYEELNLNPQN
ncbi:MAG: DUF975 family protein [Clostridia bacterium]|nr:DUF975 family protein [Clostridia bacterium]